MPKGITLGKIEKEVERLTPKDQLKLLEQNNQNKIIRDTTKSSGTE